MTPPDTILKKPPALQERSEFYLGFGYDIAKERKFILDKAGPIRGKILEIGTGKGHFTLELAKLGYRFISLDISKETQTIARQTIEQLGLKKQVEFRTENAENLSFQDAHFDFIFSINTIHHLENPLRALDEMIRVLKPQGRIILSDFTAHGFKTINKIHRSEGRKHQTGKIDFCRIENYLSNKKLKTKKYKSKFQHVLIINH